MNLCNYIFNCKNLQMKLKKRLKNIKNWCLLIFESIFFSIIPSNTLPKSSHILFKSTGLKLSELTINERKVICSYICEKGIGCVLTFCAFAFGLFGRHGPEKVFRKSGCLTVQKIKNVRSNSLCCICLCEFNYESSIKLLNCKHCFHEDCIDNWLNISNCCPICRQ